MSRKLYSLACAGLAVEPGGNCEAPVVGGPATFPPNSFKRKYKNKYENIIKTEIIILTT